MKNEYEAKCPTCGAPAMVSTFGLELVANTGDETLATKHYRAVDIAAEVINEHRLWRAGEISAEVALGRIMREALRQKGVKP